jgi:23S rRNA (guanosine2251-2'-O)-methyltransferase
VEALYRRNAVLEALRGSRRQLHRLWLEQGLNEREAQPLLAAARERGLPVQRAPRQQLTQLAGDSSHQGVVLEAGPFSYSDVESMLALAAERDEKPFLLLLDLLHGPQNIGALLRTAELCGVHGVIIQDRRAPDITPTIVTYSVGAVEHLLVAQVTNLVETMRALKEEDVWFVGMDLGDGTQSLGQVDLDMALGIVVGHEGEGLRRLVRETCDFLLRLPMRGRVDSYNAAVAGSILLFYAWEARGFQGANR